MTAKLIGNYLRKSVNENGNIELTFEISSYGSKREAEQLKKQEYRITLADVKSKRSIQQNNLLWAVIGDISQKTGINDWDIYCQLLELANAKYEYMLVLNEAIPMLKSQMRAVQDLHQIRVVNGKEMKAVKCYYGSSKFNTKEMNILIDKAMEIAEGYGINTDIYQENVLPIGG